ncbi:uncharacterized protein [Miscanthus floridulus]|uniref:uncharacterized protein n=1 Tax=Miscanthus floridulus TaxID=154761 RepID=UPI0034579EBA
MAGRFMLEKLSHSSRSRNLLGAHFSSASALLIRTTASDGGTTLSNHLRGLPAHPSTVVLSNHVIHGSVARYNSTFSFSYPAAKTRSPTTGMSSIITHPMKLAFVDSVRGPKRTFSSKIIKHNIDWEAERAAMEAHLKAIKKFSRGANLEAQNADVRADFERHKAFLENLTDTANADLAAWKAEMDKDAAEFDRLVNGILCVLTAVAMYGIYLMHSSLECHCKGQSLVAAKANVEDQNP